MKLHLFHPAVLLLISGAISAQTGMETDTAARDKEFVQRYIIHDEQIILASHPYEGRLQENRMANLFFAKNDFRIQPELSTNRIPLVIEHIDMLFSPPGSGWEVDTVVITAYASPEGDSSYNCSLAEKRARAGVSHIQEILRSRGTDKQSYVIQTEIMGEDWEGLEKILKASDLEEKEEILQIIEDQYDKDKELEFLLKDSQLADTIKVNLFPLLRRISIRIHYEEPLKTDEELLQLALSQPDELRFSQLMHAATLTGSEEEQLKIYQGACLHYKEEWKSQNNAACIYLSMNQPEKAMVYLNQASNLFPQNGIILNNMAAASLRLMRQDKALQYLELAEKEGVDVAYNRGISYLLSGSYAEAYATLGTWPCHTNAGLAAMMAGQPQKAVEHFTCSPPTATNHYLAAFCEAKTGNEAALRHQLESAIQLDTSLIHVIRNDNEFLPYKDSAWFQQMISQ
jgi:tetratricopeptide (TPR) repeat protein